MFSGTFDIDHPKIQSMKHSNNDGRTCIVTEIQDISGKLMLHFANKQEAIAFVGLFSMSLGIDNGKTSGR